MICLYIPIYIPIFRVVWDMKGSSLKVLDPGEAVPPSQLHLDEDFEKIEMKEKAAAAFGGK